MTNIQQKIAELEVRLSNIEDNLSKQPPVNSDDELMTIQQASSYTHYAVNTLYSYVKQGLIPYHKRGRKLIFSKKELLNWIKNKHL